MSERERFRTDAPGCWCPGTTTLDTLRFMGHTKECTEARRGWRANYVHLSEMARQRREDEAIGRAFVEIGMRAVSQPGEERP